MRDLLSFITGKLKTNKMTVDEFCKMIGISRQKFYRFVKEPRRFSRDNIRSMIDVLSLNDYDIAQLETYINPLKQKEISSATGYGFMISALFSRKLSEEFAMNIPNIEYTGKSGAVTMESPQSFAAIVSCFGGSDHAFSSLKHNAAVRSMTLHHEFDFAIYNCIPEKEKSFLTLNDAAGGACLTIASIIKNLEDMISVHSEIYTHVHHFLPDPLRKVLSQTDINDSGAMYDNLHILNTVLPLISTLDDYTIEQSESINHFLTEHDNLCVIRHSCEACPAEGRKNSAAVPALTEYYLLIFNGDKICCACRLGGGEASHIYRFLSVTSPGKESMHRRNTYDPNTMFSLMDRQTRSILIHSDLCFDDIPRKMWMALYRDAMNRPERLFFEKLFRNLIDPYGQYSFLSFSEIVEAAVNTLGQRFEAGKALGKIVICHPDGLAGFVHSGIIADLKTEDIDYTGKDANFAPLRFPPRMIRDLLTDLRAGILSRMNKDTDEQHTGNNSNFYILHPKFPYPETSYNIYQEGLGVIALYSKGRHKNTIVSTYPNSAVGTILYDYVVKEMINKREEGLESAILSDEHSVSLLDDLITQLDREIESAETDGASARGDRS